MKKINAIIFLVGITTVCFSQVTEDFSDGDFAANPPWSGSTTQFAVNTSQQLQLNNTVAGVSYLSTPFAATSFDNPEWRFYVKQSFSPSGSNYGRVYLMSDQADLTQALNGYYLQFGEAGANDAITLFRQTGSTATAVCRGASGKIAASFVARVKISRDNTGLWQLYVDYTGGTNFVLDAHGTDTGTSGSLFFGVSCTYTVSNATKFYYDDFYAGPASNDATAPTVLAVDTTSANTVAVHFSESVEPISAESVLNYSVDHSIGNPLTATLAGDGATVSLSFAKTFSNGIQNELDVSSIKDLAGNPMIPVAIPFTYLKAVIAQTKDIIFTEIFPDPSPPVGLPGQEYLEIFNRSSSPFDLSGWTLTDGTSTATFGSQIILPDQYWVVCSSVNLNLFSSYRNVIGITGFPALNNDGDNLTLRDPDNQTIDSVNYTLDWYHDGDKQEGGWSLEMIDPNNVCGEEENWAASDDPSGGTPGKQNSVFANKPDLSGPQLLSVSPQSPTLLILTFNEKLEKDLSEALFTISPSTAIEKKYFKDQGLRQVALVCSENLMTRELYTIFAGNISDCSGNLIQPDFSQLSFALPEPADSLDIIVNEILFNPRPGGVDFVEVYNNSPKFINLKNWKLGNYQNNVFENPQTITTSDFILAPAGYVAFTADPPTLMAQYPQSVLKNLFKANLPSLSDDEGSIALVSDQALTIDHFLYSQKMHSPFIKDNEGVSLERVSFSGTTNDNSNWRSAASTSGFATPGFINSNARPESPISEGAITMDPEIFSPNTPGRDFSRVNFKFDQSGMVANIKILDVQGRLIKTLANNETLGYEGFYRWDGDRDDGSRARVGYYVVWVEVFDTGGSVRVYRKRAIIGK